jgi:hypothetical protein
MEDKKGIKALAALLQDPKKNTNDPNVWNSDYKNEDNKELKKISDNIKEIRNLSSPALKEFRGTQKGTLTVLAKIEKSLSSSTKETSTILSALNTSIESQAQPKSEQTKKESANAESSNEILSFLSGGGMGAVGGAAAAAGAVGVSSLSEGVSSLAEKAKELIKNPTTGGGLAAVLDEQEREEKRSLLKPGEMGPPSAVAEQQQAAANKAVDEVEAKRTLEKAGFQPTIKSQNIQFSEAQFLEKDPDTYKKFKEVEKTKYKEMVDAGTDKDIAEMKSRTFAISKFKKEIESSGAGKIEETEQDNPEMRDAIEAQAAREAMQRGLRQRKGRQEKVPIPARTEETEAVKPNDNEEQIYQKLLQKYPESMRNDVAVQRDAREEARLMTSSKSKTPTNPAVIAEAKQRNEAESEMIDVQSKQLEEGARSLGLDPNNVSGNFQGNQLVSIVDSKSGKEYDVTDRLNEKQKGSVEAARKLQEMLSAPQQNSSNNIQQMSRENRDLERENTLGGAVQPIVIQSNNNMNTQTAIPIKADPRTQSSFTRYNDSRASY